MAFGGNKKEVEREDIVELGIDTDAHICRELGGTHGSDKKCRLIKAGVNDDGNVVLKSTKGSQIKQIYEK